MIQVKLWIVVGCDRCAATEEVLDDARPDVDVFKARVWTVWEEIGWRLGDDEELCPDCAKEQSK